MTQQYALPSLTYLNRRSVVITAVYGLVLLLSLILPAYQLWHAYRSGEGLDVDQTDFLIGAVLFLWVAAGAAILFRRLFLVLGFRHKASKLTVIPEYVSRLSPTEAGVMIDAASSRAETAALLTNLRSKRVITMVPKSGSWIIHRADPNINLTEDEKVFVGSLFQSNATVVLAPHDSRIVAAAEAVRQAALQRLASAGMVPKLTIFQVMVGYIRQCIVWVGIIIGFFNILAYWSPEAYIIKYPRYSVEFWQLGFILAIPLIVVIVAAAAYRSSLFNKAGMEQYRQAAGLYMYIKTVLRGRFGNGYLSADEEAYYLPYAQAFGLDDGPQREFASILPPTK